MAIATTAQGNQLEVIVGSAKEQYVNFDDMDLAINGTKVIIRDNSSNSTLSNDLFSEYSIGGGNAQTVARNIAKLSAGSSQGVQIINPAIAGAEETSVAANASSVELLAADADNVEARIRNDGTGILFITEGATATANSANKLLQDDVYVAESALVVNGIWVGVNGFARINKNTK